MTTDEQRTISVGTRAMHPPKAAREPKARPQSKAAHKASAHRPVPIEEQHPDELPGIVVSDGIAEPSAVRPPQVSTPPSTPNPAPQAAPDPAPSAGGGMDAVQVLRILRRQWRWTAVLSVLLVALCTATVLTVPQQHRVTGVLLALSRAEPDAPNPYAQVDRAQEQVTALVVTVLNSPRTQQELAAAGALGEIEVSNEEGQVSEDSPFLTVTVTADEPADAVRTAAIVLDRARAELSQRQTAAGVASAQHIEFNEVLAADLPTTTRAAQLRSVVLVAGLGLVLVLAIVITVDRVRRDQRSR
ncbi:YveK family protein [Actinoalloteichus hymeniacidonis]|uniref:Capsular polysaccharide biosynthesis protein n=1 Tax=Actinoalloteichus hymeniacidonis TaxID=340345 RepID=A0AAC9HUZ4_9PSEU|nr:hypothetical protein [Actinoalloteichus hymeniacidonis]AOS65903.1 hypothetical protein TL08_25650 [Actinoalloteichus hymeniacidonis]MBB5906001.1 hypothetical protein [Actinoalloteichus hymeniacidonis]